MEKACRRQLVIIFHDFQQLFPYHIPCWYSISIGEIPNVHATRGIGWVYHFSLSHTLVSSHDTLGCPRFSWAKLFTANTPTSVADIPCSIERTMTGLEKRAYHISLFPTGVLYPSGSLWHLETTAHLVRCFSSSQTVKLRLDLPLNPLKSHWILLNPSHKVTKSH